jgi:hypothetical protein
VGRTDDGDTYTAYQDSTDGGKVTVSKSTNRLYPVSSSTTPYFDLYYDDGRFKAAYIVPDDTTIYVKNSQNNGYHIDYGTQHFKFSMDIDGKSGVAFQNTAGYLQVYYSTNTESSTYEIYVSWPQPTNIDFTFDSSNNALIAYTDTSNSTCVIRVSAGDRTSAVKIGDSISADSVQNRIVTDGDDNVYVGTISSSGVPQVLKYNGSESWSPIGNFSGMTVTDLSMAISPIDEIFIAYRETTGDLTDLAQLRTWDGDSWYLYGGTEVTSFTVAALSMIIHPFDDTIHLVFADSRNGDMATQFKKR